MAVAVTFPLRYTCSAYPKKRTDPTAKKRSFSLPKIYSSRLTCTLAQYQFTGDLRVENFSDVHASFAAIAPYLTDGESDQIGLALRTLKSHLDGVLALHYLDVALVPVVRVPKPHGIAD